MKKIIGMILLAQSILICIVGLHVYKNISYTNLLYEDNTAILVRAEEEDKLTSFLNEKSEKDNITISKYAYIDDDNLVIYTNDISLGGKISIKEYLKGDTESVVANYKSTEENQIAKFYLFGSNQKITIFPLEKIKNDGVDGLYYIRNEFAEQVVNEINSDIGYAEVYYDYSVNIASYIENCFEMIIAIVMVTIILVVSIIHYIVSRTKKIAILKIQGLSVGGIVKNIFSELFVTQCVVYILGTAGMTMYGAFRYGINSIVKVFEIYLASFLISTLIYCIISMLVLLFEIIYGKMTDMLKGKKPYKIILVFHIFLKGIFLMGMIVGCLSLYIQIRYLKIEQGNLDIWKKAESVYSVGLNYVGESRSSEVKLKEFYSLMEQNGGFLIDAQNYELVDGENHLYDINAPGEESYYDPYGRTITVNENYLELNPISINGNMASVVEKINHDDKVRNILVPENLKNYEKEIRTRFLQDFYFQKVEVENIYNEKLQKPMNDLSLEELSLNIIYIDEGQTYFPYVNLEVQNGCRIINPIVVVETGNIDASYYTSYLSRCMFFKYEGMNAFDYMLPFIEKSNTTSEIQNVTSVYNNHGEEIYNLTVRRNYLITALSVTIIMFFTSNYLIISSFFQEKKYQIYIKKVFGFSLSQRIANFVLLLFAVDMITLCITVVYTQNAKSALLLGFVVTVIDMFMVFIESNQLDKRNFNIIIKGEH